MPPSPHPPPALPPGYGPLLADLKSRVRIAQIKAATAVNTELVMLHWSIERSILLSQRAEGWGSKVVDRLAKDLRKEFPDMRGFSRANLLFMRAFAEAWPDLEIVQQPVRQLPWGHNLSLLTKLKDPEIRSWYARRALEHGWSRAILQYQIESRLHDREGKAITNFAQTLPSPQSDLAQQLLKDPYNFDFLTLSGDAKERELEKGLIDHVQKLLLELGIGFAFVGRQVTFDLAGKTYTIDLLFYHLKLRCFIVVDLKTGDFEPEHAGKLNFHLSLVDDRMRHESDAPTIGLILAGGRDRITVEYALRDIDKPIGVAEWRTRIVESLPRNLRGALPRSEDLSLTPPEPEK
ncbi:MAG: PDDEXK nuclease domain-containing protein [Planctomycetota bacterium]